VSCSDLADHRAAVVDELGQHHDHVVVDGGGVVRPLARVPHERPQGEDGGAPHLHDEEPRVNPSLKHFEVKNVHSTELLEDTTIPFYCEKYSF